MNSALARKALEKHFALLRPAIAIQPPPRGWTRAIRDALGMTATQLAQRMGISQPSVTALEQDEARQTITLARLQRAAEALDCTLVYALVPRYPLDERLQARAHEKAGRMLSSVHTTMMLEAQHLSAATLAEEQEELAAELMRENIHRLWDQ